VKSEPELRQILARLESLGLLAKPFFEPDRAGQLTALATAPVRGDQRRWLRRYRCLTAEQPEPCTLTLEPTNLQPAPVNSRDE